MCLFCPACCQSGQRLWKMSGRENPWSQQGLLQRTGLSFWRACVLKLVTRFSHSRVVYTGSLYV